VLAVYLAVAPRSDIYVTANVVAVPAIALMILSLAQQDGGLLASGPLLTLGRASYAFYSLQPLVITAMIRWQRGAPQWNSLAAFCGALASLATLSLLAYFFVEEPMRRRLANRGG
jgi:peptidoglycan/LPS O-acetylase OafA/YrhL